MKRCSHCQNENPDGVSWCEMCGMELVPAKRNTTAEPLRPLPPTPQVPASPHEKRRTVFDPGAEPAGAPARPEPNDYFGKPPPPRPALDPRDPFGGSVPPPAAPAAQPVAAPPAAARPKARTLVESSGPSAPAATGLVRAALFEYRGPTDTGRIHPLQAGRNMIGRDEGCAVVLPDARVSGQHGFIFVRAEDATYVDMSTNGSVVDGKVINGEQVVLQNHAVLRLGDTTLVLALIPESVLPRRTR